MTGRMARLVLLAQSPPHLDGDQTEAWLRRELDALVGKPGVLRVSLSRLESVSIRFARSWDWLIEMECAAAEDAVRATSNSAFRDLYGDLRLIGMRPSLALANRPVELAERPPS
jgi:hypothetical protein